MQIAPTIFSVEFLNAILDKTNISGKTVSISF